MPWSGSLTTPRFRRGAIRFFFRPPTTFNICTHEKIREIGPVFNRNRPFVVDGQWTRVYANNNGFLGFTAADISTGNILYRIDYGPIPCRTSSGAHGTCVHGLALAHDEKTKWF